MSKWLADMDFDALVRCTRGKKLAAPIKPELSGTTDTSNFEEYPEGAEELLRPNMMAQTHLKTFESCQKDEKHTNEVDQPASTKAACAPRTHVMSML
eukprot:CCRYP_010202-RA/>CCRYP_010202-RA protein AED:0.61 eAED:0.41 QI:0/0/0/0.5/1/1/2/0/96